jgi:signal transduction histidine kinase
MRLFHKIALVLVAAAALPLATVGFALVARNERALEGEVRGRFDQTARHAAEAVAADVEGRARQLAQTAAMIRWSELAPDEARGALALLRRQAKAAAAELRDGRGVRTSDALAVAEAGAPVEAELGAHAPFERARKEGPGAVVFSTPYRVAPLGITLAAALSVGGDGVVALAIPLAGEARRLDEVRGDGAATLTLVDDRGGLLAQSGAAIPPAPTVIADALAAADGHARRYRAGDEMRIASFAPVGGLGWSLIVEEDAARAFAAPRALRTLTLATTGVAVAAAVALAFLLARRLTAALERLAGAARAFGRGQLDLRVDERASDEVGALARAFNAMGGELAESRAEIERWNRELEARVAARTRELKDAQAQLVQAQKLAALGQLGAGVAHEINNPLGGVIGHVQLLLAGRDQTNPDWEALTCIEEGARKAAQVVQNLLRFSVQHQTAVRTAVDVNRLVRDTLALTTTLLAEQKILLALELDPRAPRLRADGGQVAQVLLNLVQNARTAMRSGGTLTIRTQGANGEVALIVADSGKGIAPEIKERIFEPFFTTKDEWSNVGLGLSVSWRIVEEHGGRITVESEVGRGATFTVHWPAMAAS